MLDGDAATDGPLRDAVAWIDAHRSTGPVLVHCALGHGRTGSVVLAWLLSRGNVATAGDGVALLKSRRETFGISREQLDAIERFVAARDAPRV